jgi:RNA polymerase sigma factor for flagellar operon FliA
MKASFEPGLSAEGQARVLSGQGLIPPIVVEVHRRYPALLAREELEALGYEGLVQAARAFDPAQGVPFTTFARFRIMGAMLDGVREEARFWRQQAAGRRAAVAWLEEEHGTVDVLHVTEEEARQDMGSFLDGLAAAIFSNMVVAAQPERAGEDELLVREAIARARWALDRAMAGLGAYDQGILRAVYYEGKTAKEAASEAGLSYPSFRRHLKGATLHLAARLRALGVTQAPPVMDGVWASGMSQGEGVQR